MAISETTWNELYPSLRSLAKHFVKTLHVSCWLGQENDIVEDIVQESAQHILEHSLRAERQEVEPIYSLKKVIWTVVRNCCIDLGRRDCRLMRTSLGEFALEGFSTIDEQKNLFEEAIENVYQKEIFTLLASEIVHFPAKQRRALLIDLANRMSFDTEPTPLQEAFLAVGIQLREYQQPLPDSQEERNRHISLLSLAYRRAAHLLCMQQFITKDQI